MSDTKNVTVARVKFKGEALDGTYPLVRIDDTSVVIRHPTHGSIRVALANTNLPASAPVTLSYDDLVAEIKDRFNTLERVIHGIIEGRQRSVIISGAPGIGKTWTTEHLLEKAKAGGKIGRLMLIRGTISAAGLYETLWDHRNAGDVIVLDDTDAVFNSEDGCNIIKAATDSGKKRTVSYMKDAHFLEANGIPRSFNYQGAIIIASNLDFEGEIASKSKLSVHLSAVLNRALYLDLAIRSNQALLARIEDVATTTPMLREEGLSEEQIGDVVNWLKSNAPNVRSLSLRTAARLAGLIMSEPESWKKTAKATLLKNVSR